MRVNEAKGFAGWILILVVYVAYIIWAFVPDEKLHSWNITYYPSKYWAVALPSYVVVVLFLVVLGFVGASIITTPSLSSYDVLKDSAVPTADSMNYNVSHLAPFTVPGIEDLPLQQASDKLHL